MKGFLLEENLPCRLRVQPSKPTCHSNDVGSHPSDGDLWNYAQKNELVIVTKDADFSDRIFSSSPPPWVIHFRSGNMHRSDYHRFVETIWPRLEELMKTNKLLNVYLDRIEIVS